MTDFYSDEPTPYDNLDASWQVLDGDPTFTPDAQVYDGDALYGDYDPYRNQSYESPADIPEAPDASIDQDNGYTVRTTEAGTPQDMTPQMRRRIELEDAVEAGMRYVIDTPGVESPINTKVPAVANLPDHMPVAVHEPGPFGPNVVFTNSLEELHDTLYDATQMLYSDAPLTWSQEKEVINQIIHEKSHVLGWEAVGQRPEAMRSGLLIAKRPDAAPMDGAKDDLTEYTTKVRVTPFVMPRLYTTKLGMAVPIVAPVTKEFRSPFQERHFLSDGDKDLLKKIGYTSVADIIGRIPAYNARRHNRPLPEITI